MATALNEYCSWCNVFASHYRAEKNTFTRSIYTCQACKKSTVQCRYCKNMAKTGGSWSDELCAEHDGTIASFKKLGLKLKDISDYSDIFRGQSTNLMPVAKIGVGFFAGAVIFIPIAQLAAAPLAAAIGASGILGVAGTGTAISTLTGAALSSASLAAMGGGTMAGGALIFSAAGAALGGYQGAAVSNSYFGEVDHFDILKLKPAKGRSKKSVIVINGFMSQSDYDSSDWTDQLSSHFVDHAWYHTDWEAKSLQKLGSYAFKSPKIAGLEIAKNVGKRAIKSAAGKITPITLVNHISDIIGNPWHSTMTKAMMTGAMLADAIARTPGQQFTLIGHSLGARVIYYALKALSTSKSKKKMIENVYLLGGAVGGGVKDNDDWEKATRSVEGKIFNCYSEKDMVLKYLYQGANAGISTPIGYKKIALKHEKIHNFDCEALVGGHFGWKRNLDEILTQLKT